MKKNCWKIISCKTFNYKWIALNESLQDITLELQFKLVTNTVKVPYQLLYLIHFIAIFSLYESWVHQKTGCFDGRDIDREYWKDLHLL